MGGEYEADVRDLVAAERFARNCYLNYYAPLRPLGIFRDDIEEELFIGEELNGDTISRV